MPICLCTVCDELFDSDDQVEAQYVPPVCEDCLMEAEEENNNWWAAMDADESWIKENL